MTHAALLTAIYTKIGTIAGLPAIAYPNVNFTPTGDYVAAYVLPAETVNECIDGGIYKSGVIQIDCVTADKVGELKAARYADLIISAFPVGTVITAGVTVNRPTYASGGMATGDGHYKIPVTIRYRAYE